jgi:hypothetical protein
VTEWVSGDEETTLSAIANPTPNNPRLISMGTGVPTNACHKAVAGGTI